MAKKIFVLDDDERICALVGKRLTEAGYEVKTQSKPLISDNDLKKFGPDLIVLDVMMDWLTGDAIADALDYSFRERPKIIFLSSKEEDELAELAREKQVEGYVCKPQGVAALLEKVKEVLEQ